MARLRPYRRTGCSLASFATFRVSDSRTRAAPVAAAWESIGSAPGKRLAAKPRNL